MNNYTKERILGSLILLGGGFLLSAMLYQTSNERKIALAQQQALNADNVLVTDAQVTKNSQHTGLQMTADYETEKRILAKKREQRDAQVADREKKIKALMEEQTKAEADAIAKAQKEAKKAVADKQLAQAKKAQHNKKLLEDARKDAKKLKAEKAKQRKAEATKRKKLEALAAQQKKQAEKQAQKQKEVDYIEAKQRLRKARAESNKSKGTFGVQVALAANEKNAQDLMNRIKKHGYKVSSSRTSRGIRVIVGPERGRKAALALKDKINADKRLKLNGAWVMHVNTAHLSQQNANMQARENNAKQLKAEKIKQEKERKENLAKQKQDKQRFGIQVAMAGNKQSADALIAKLTKNGYKVTTSHTSRGTRIIVGSQLKKEEALKLQAKVNTDKRIGISGAWLRRER